MKEKISINSLHNDITSYFCSKSFSYTGKVGQAFKDYSDIFQKTLGIKFIPHEELEKNDILLAGLFKDRVVVALLPDNEKIIFSNKAQTKDIAKMKKRATQYLIEYMRGNVGPERIQLEKEAQFPEHVRLFLRHLNFDPPSLEILNNIFGRLEFKYNGIQFKFRSSKSDEIISDMKVNRSAFQYLRYRIGPGDTKISKVQITLAEEMKIRIGKRGISIPDKFPDTIVENMAGEKLESVVQFGIFDDFIIEEAVKSNRVIQMRLKMI